MFNRARRFIRLFVTALILTAAGFAVSGLWLHYMVAPWTRDGEVRVEVLRELRDLLVDRADPSLPLGVEIEAVAPKITEGVLEEARARAGEGLLLLRVALHDARAPPRAHPP